MCDSSDSGGSSDSGCSANFDSPSSPMNDSGSICGPSSPIMTGPGTICEPPAPLTHPGMDDLMLYGMSVEMLTADSRSREINRRRIAPEDFVIMRSANVIRSQQEDQRRVWEQEILTKRYGGDPASKLPETNVEPPHLCSADPFTPPCQEESDLNFWHGYGFGIVTMIMVWAAWNLGHWT